MTRKRKSKRSETFSLLAHRCWSKTVDDNNSVTETQNHMAAVASVVDEIEWNIVY